MTAMKLAVSNIAWPASRDEEMLAFIRAQSVHGLEVAPTRLFPRAPYDHTNEAGDFARRLLDRHGLTIPSMQSIWYGVVDNLFSGEIPRQRLVAYTKKAIDFAAALACPTLVFGCPKNRAFPVGATAADKAALLPAACDFFHQIGDYAASCGMVIAIEPNPPIYGTDFLNTTEEAFRFCSRLDNPGVRLNLDLGTTIHNGENDLGQLEGYMPLVSHIHISEPFLAPPLKRPLHAELIPMLRRADYAGFLSIEMRDAGDLGIIKDAIRYIGELLAS